MNIESNEYQPQIIRSEGYYTDTKPNRKNDIKIRTNLHYQTYLLIN